MLILSRVCAEFHDKTGAVIHRVTPETRLTFREAPEAIREDPLFSMLVSDGSLEAALTSARKKVLEAEPLKDTDAAGRKTSGTRPAAEAGRSRQAAGEAEASPASAEAAGNASAAPKKAQKN